MTKGQREMFTNLQSELEMNRNCRHCVFLCNDLGGKELLSNTLGRGLDINKAVKSFFLS